MVETFKNYFSRWTLNSQKFRCVWWNPTPHTAHLPQHCRLGDSGRSFVLCLFIWSEIENVHIMIELLSIWHPIGDKTTITTRQQFSLRENIKIGLYARWNSSFQNTINCVGLSDFITLFCSGGILGMSEFQKLTTDDPICQGLYARLPFQHGLGKPRQGGFARC